MKEEIASSYSYDELKLLNGADLTSREIGLFSGPLGGAIVKDLIKEGEKAVMEKYTNKE